MRIGIYARGLSGLGGVKQYIDAMCRALIRNVDEGDELVIVHNCRAPYFGTGKANVSERVIPVGNKLGADFVFAPRVLNGLNLDVSWFTKYVIPFGVKGACVTTVHDMAYFMPKLAAYRRTDTLYMRAMITRSLKRADRVVAVSHNTKADIHRITGLQDDKVAVIHEAAGKHFRKLRNKRVFATFRERYGLPEDYILFTGGISPRKNLLRLIRAFRAVAGRVPHHLVITGAKGWRNKSVKDAIAADPRIVQTGFIEDDDMPLLYNGASLFVYPSLYEGFGLPVLEAQKCGCPVICSENSSLVEVGGQGVRFIDPLDEGGLADAIASLMTNEDERHALIKKGYDNAKRFSWDRAAKALLLLLGEVGAQRAAN